MDREALIADAVQSSVDAGFAVTDLGVLAARHAAKFVANRMSATQSHAATVKPLLWDNGHQAETPFGSYSAVRSHTTPLAKYCLIFQGKYLAADYASRGAAKEHAQADYEQRIRSALAHHSGDEVR